MLCNGENKAKIYSYTFIILKVQSVIFLNKNVLFHGGLLIMIYNLSSPLQVLKINQFDFSSHIYRLYVMFQTENINREAQVMDCLDLIGHSPCCGSPGLCVEVSRNALL